MNLKRSLSVLLPLTSLGIAVSCSGDFSTSVEPNSGALGGAAGSGDTTSTAGQTYGGAGGTSGGEDETVVAEARSYRFDRCDEGATSGTCYQVSAEDGLLAGSVASAKAATGERTTARGGTVVIEEDGSFSYSPPTDVFWGSDSFEYELENDSSSDTATVRLTVDVSSIALSEIASGDGNGFVIRGPAGGISYLGDSVASAGDVNGDGLDDVLVGATYSGKAYVVFGRKASTPVEASAVEQGEEDGFAILGTSATGTRVAKAGDINGDGLDDLLVGASETQVGAASSAGRVYVVYGKTNKEPVSLAALVTGSPLGFVISGAQASGGVGASVAGLGDVNGDRLDDFAIGAPGYKPGSKTNAGAVVVVLGSTAAQSNKSFSDFVVGSSAGYAIFGAAADDKLGGSITALGDINSDGYSDIGVGSRVANGTGRGYAVFGGTAYTSVDLAGSMSGFVIDGYLAGEEWGTVAGSGDLNQDGADDILIAARPAASAFAVWGKASTAAVSLTSLADGSGPGFRMTGDGGYETRAAGGGDFDGDGVPDFLIGAPNRGTGGLTYLVFGRSATTALALPDLGDAGLSISGANSSDSAGQSVALLGDVNGDGFDDALVGAPYADPNGTVYAGEAYVVFGWDHRGAAPASYDVFQGSSEDDTWDYNGGSLLRVNGGHGFDTLAVEGENNTIDSTKWPSARVRGLDAIDLTGSGNNTLILDEKHVRWMTEPRRDGAIWASKSLSIIGNSGDVLVFDLTGFSNKGTNAGRTVYAKDGAKFAIEVDSAVTLQAP